MTRDRQESVPTPGLKLFRIGDYVHFYDSYNRNPKDAVRRTGVITSLLNQYYGVTPINSDKELFFHPEELMKPDKPRAVQQRLRVLEHCEE